ncbi:unnamed protein product [Gordionus sp. m RMFG-2023]
MRASNYSNSVNINNNLKLSKQLKNNDFIKSVQRRALGDISNIGLSHIQQKPTNESKHIFNNDENLKFKNYKHSSNQKLDPEDDDSADDIENFPNNEIYDDYEDILPHNEKPSNFDFKLEFDIIDYFDGSYMLDYNDDIIDEFLTQEIPIYSLPLTQLEELSLVPIPEETDLSS